MTRTMLVSDVRRKRDVRDFLFHKGYDIFVRMLNDKKVKMDTMFDYVLKTYDVDKKAPEEEKANAILNHMIDIRLFGSTMAFDKKEGVRSFTGPVQISWGYSLHPVDLIQSSSIVTIMNDGNSTFGKMYKAHYAMVAHSGTVNKYAAEKTWLTEADYELFRKASHLRVFYRCLLSEARGFGHGRSVFYRDPGQHPDGFCAEGESL